MAIYLVEQLSMEPRNEAEAVVVRAKPGGVSKVVKSADKELYDGAFTVTVHSYDCGDTDKGATADLEKIWGDFLNV